MNRCQMLIQQARTTLKVRENNKGIDAIVIGSSTGGPNALKVMLPELCKRVAVPIFIVQHMPPLFTANLATNLDWRCCHEVTEARQNGMVKPEHVYIAPAGRHLQIRKTQEGIRTMLTNQAPQHGCRPAADVLFNSAAPVYGTSAIAIILTGMGCDGTQGIKTLKQKGAYIVAQDKESSVVWGMPGKAVESGHVDEIVSLMAIPKRIEKYILKIRRKCNGH